MNILILTMNIGGNAPGVSFERLISGLSDYHNIDVFTVLNNATNYFTHVNSIEVVPYIDMPGFRKSQLILLLGLNPFDLLWAHNVKNRIRKKKGKYDIIISFVSNEHYAGLIAGVILSKILKTKLAAFSVDAIPAPLGWSIDNLYFRSCRKFIDKYLSKVDILFAANKKMLDYQKSFLKNSNIVFDVVYNPSPPQLCVYKEAKEHIFLYTGEIYQVRRVKYLFKALQLILKEYPQVELHFVGSRIPVEEFEILNATERDAIRIYPWTHDLNSFYERSYCLIDIDADIENDVYLSSKINNYVMTNRPILCETGKNSPSRQIMHGIPSILQCNHNSEEIYYCMKKVIENPITNFSDRKEIIKLFSIDNIVRRMNDRILETKS